MIVFASDEEVDEVEQPGIISPYGRLSTYERYVTEIFDKPGYHRIRIGLKRISHALRVIQESWQTSSRSQTLSELENLLCRQHELEKQIENVQDSLVREYIFTRLDEIAALRRSIAEDIRWDIESVKAPE